MAWYALGIVGVYASMMLFVTSPAPAFADTGDSMLMSGATATGSTSTGTTTTGTSSATITEATTTSIYITKQTSQITDDLEALIATASTYPSRTVYKGNNKKMYEAMRDYLYYKTAIHHQALLSQFIENLKQQDADFLQAKYNIYADSMFAALEEIAGTPESSSSNSSSQSTPTASVSKKTSNTLYTTSTAKHKGSTFTLYEIKEGIGIKTATFHFDDTTTYTCRWLQCNHIGFNTDEKEVTDIFATTTHEESMHLSF